MAINYIGNISLTKGKIKHKKNKYGPKYWRLRATSNIIINVYGGHFLTTYWIMREIRAYDNINKNGRNYLSDVPVEASTYYNSNSLPENAVNGVLDDAWASAQNSGHYEWISFELDESNNIKLFDMYMHTDSIDKWAYTPTEFVVETSTDKTNWNIIKTVNPTVIQGDHYWFSFEV